MPVYVFSTLRTRLISMGAVLLCVVTDEEGKWLLEGEGQVELIYILRIDDVEDHSARERLTD